MKFSFGSLAIAALALAAAGSVSQQVTSGGGTARSPAAKGPAAESPAEESPAEESPAEGTVIKAHITAFGPALVVGSGKYKGFSLYFITSDFITSDHGRRHFGCTARPVDAPTGKLLCTGPSSDGQAEWPAITTVGKPRAAAGVSQSHLGTVWRAHVGRQITYYSHPLYLFHSGPAQVSGEGWDEPSMPPWHGVWYLMSPSGKAAPWPGALTTVRLRGHKVLAAPMLTGRGWLDFPVYRYTKDRPFSGTSRCSGSCARTWPPLLTSSFPGVSTVSLGAHVGTIRAPDGTQASYAGHPLYLFAGEVIVKAGSSYKATGSGNDITTNGGTFKLVTA